MSCQWSDKQPMTAFSNIGAPAHELTRSSAAHVIGDLAQASGLFLSHFEYRHHMPLPDAWCPPNQPGFSAQPYWKAGHLVEQYRHFRYDNPIGSFHPSHDPKWTAHELCHALIGFAWRPNASPLFHSLSARLSELLPVALWYFFDEIDLRRCRQHAGLGDLFGLRCPACEQAASGGPSVRTRNFSKMASHLSIASLPPSHAHVGPVFQQGIDTQPSTSTMMH